MSKFRKSLSPTYRRQKGFTLIELLVVIAIIAILAAIVLAALGQARAKGRDAQRRSEIKSIQTALEMVFDDNGSYPAALPGNNQPLQSGGRTYMTIPTPPGGSPASYAATYTQTRGSTTYDISCPMETSGNFVQANP